MSFVIGHGGVGLNVATAGDPGAPAILLLHGWAQHSLSWRRQLQALSDEFFVLAPDLRGHGESGKPEEKSAYDTSEPWAGDVAAVIHGFSLNAPVLVGWSMGGWVAQDYIRHHGDSAISGLALVGTGVTTGSEMPEAARKERAGRADVLALGMYSADQPTNLAATLAFTKACSEAPLSPEDFALNVGYAMLCPAYARHPARTRSEDYRETTAAVRVRAALIVGKKDPMAVTSLRREAHETLPDAQVITYEGVGHSPFLEVPDLFNRDLAEFARACHANATTGVSV
ncbi:MAG: alpha/beta hydrolase [Pseudomonadota bacterium]